MRHDCALGDLARVVCLVASAAGCGFDHAAARGARLVTTPCVLHAGGGERARAADGTVRASCWYGAECVAHPGRSGPGDGFVGIACEGAVCTCTWSNAVEAPAAETTVRASFPIEGACGEDHSAARLVQERCMRRMQR